MCSGHTAAFTPNEQHEDGASECEEKKLNGGKNAARTTPDADDNVHRDQHGFEEDVENDEIRGGEHAYGHGFQEKKCDHKVADTLGNWPG